VRQCSGQYQHIEQKNIIRLDSVEEGENNTRFSGFARGLSITLRSDAPKSWSMSLLHYSNTSSPHILGDGLSRSIAHTRLACHTCG